MNWIGIGLCLIGTAAVLAYVDANAQAEYHEALSFSATPSWALGAAAGFTFLRKHVQRRWRLFFGPYPLLLIYIWAGKLGLVRDRNQAAGFLDELRRAAIKGELEFYGQLITATGVERQLKKIPPVHLETYAISLNTSLPLAKGGNEEIFTYDQKRGVKASQQVGHYCNLHVSRRVLRITVKIWEGAQG